MSTNHYSHTKNGSFFLIKVGFRIYMLVALENYGSFFVSGTSHFLYGDRGANDLCGKFPPMVSEKYLAIFNHAYFYNDARQSHKEVIY